MTSRTKCWRKFCIALSLYSFVATSPIIASSETWEESQREHLAETPSDTGIIPLNNHSFIAGYADSQNTLPTFKLFPDIPAQLSKSHFDMNKGPMLLPQYDHSFKEDLLGYGNAFKADLELMRDGRREYFPDTFSRQWSILRFVVHSFRIEQTMIRGTASLWMTDYLETSINMWAEGIGRTTRIDLKVTIRNLPLVKQARLVSRYFQLSTPREMWHEPWLERGYKMNVGDISLTEGRFFSNLELQFPELLGGRGIVGAFRLDAEHGLGLGFNVDLPNLEIPGTRFKLKMPDIRFVLFH